MGPRDRVHPHYALNRLTSSAPPPSMRMAPSPPVFLDDGLRLRLGSCFSTSTAALLTTRRANIRLAAAASGSPQRTRQTSNMGHDGVRMGQLERASKNGILPQRRTLTYCVREAQHTPPPPASCDILVCWSLLCLATIRVSGRVRQKLVQPLVTSANNVALVPVSLIDSYIQAPRPFALGHRQLMENTLRETQLGSELAVKPDLSLANNRLKYEAIMTDKELTASTLSIPFGLTRVTFAYCSWPAMLSNCIFEAIRSSFGDSRYLEVMSTTLDSDKRKDLGFDYLRLALSVTNLPCV
ncbi:hypothetical protein CCUS01_15233 [Colletotrichum cuscutae]|uniref:Uncharacterized protein n=1 Tax=Colletotrichum cuscutae TaxID=1209917 RepID=A0AAI9VEN6_9PEZI|nr:hypothetical protein CCUS01_15233 [Colletotrichum cuscutae]